MILLALDTCDSRGSLAVLRDDEVLATLRHEGTSDYSTWVLPTADEALTAAGLRMVDIDVFAVASGPGSFTGVRVGLTTVKAWSEAYGKPAAGVSRLEAMGSAHPGDEGLVAAFVDAHREQVFGGLFRRAPQGLILVEQEMVVAPEGFVKWVEERAAGKPVSWVSMDPEKISSLEVWAAHASAGESILLSPNALASAIGKIGRQRARAERLTDALGLDAEYIRRTDAEIFSKGGAKVAS
ncbi:MAG: tRNA (adenosine(37)-N6)-threonylcarbamoyltransferase complex dimerization subunit type 1 TsaB [Candidatus Acidiferrum sp.]